MKLSITLTLAATVALTAGQASAHHSFAMFDNQKEVTLEGTIREFQWTNPHTWVQILVRDESGQDIEWSIEGSSPNNLVRRGWSKLSMKAGDKAIVVIHPLKKGGPGGSLIRITVNGTVVGDPSPVG